MSDYTEVSKLLDEHKRASEKASEYSRVASLKLHEARSKCAHPAWKKESEPREDEYGKTTGYDQIATCLVCGHIEGSA